MKLVFSSPIIQDKIGRILFKKGFKIKKLKIVF